MKGYVYSLWSGRFLCKEATIKNYPEDSRNKGLAFARFDNGSCIEVNQTPGEMHNAIVWLKERDDSNARDILIKYQENQISKLNEKIENHLHKIEELKKEVNYNVR